jgi:hypothetical protein
MAAFGVQPSKDMLMLYKTDVNNNFMKQPSTYSYITRYPYLHVQLSSIDVTF